MPSEPRENAIAMRGEGGYNANSALQQVAVVPALQLIPNLSKHHSISTLDLGCSQGANSIVPLKQLLSTLPDGSSVHIAFEDTAYNDFNTLSLTLKEHERDLDRNGELKFYPTLLPRSFYNQVAPDSSVDIAFSWSSLNYLEHDLPPIPATDLNTMLQKRFLRSAEVAHRDLVKLLKLRATEVKQGGAFIAAVGGRASNSTPNLPPVSGSMMAALQGMVGDGKISIHQLLSMDPPVHERSMEEIEKAFTEVDNLWRVESKFEEMIPHPAIAPYKAARAIANAAESERLDKDIASTIVDWIVSAATWMIVKAFRIGRGYNGNIMSPMSVNEESLIEEVTERMKDIFLKQFIGSVDQSQCCYVYFKLVRK